MDRVFNITVYDGNRPAKYFNKVNEVLVDESGALWVPQADKSGFSIFAKRNWSEVKAVTVK